MHNNATLKSLLKQHTKRYINLAQDRFERKFETPYIEIVPDSKEVGRACPLDWSVQLNESLLASKPEDMLHIALPHEIAHLIDLKLNLKTYAAMQRIPWHGYGWKQVMKLFNVTPSVYYDDIT